MCKQHGTPAWLLRPSTPHSLVREMLTVPTKSFTRPHTFTLRGAFCSGGGSVARRGLAGSACDHGCHYYVQSGAN